MLLQTMTQDEITSEIFKDFENIYPRTVERLTSEFERELRRNKIPKKREYYKVYQIKSGRKNPWTLIYSQDTNDKNSVRAVIYTYYYTEKGLRVFEVSEDMKTLMVYNGHLFQRYNERMKLNLPNTLESAKQFFINNSQRMIKTVSKDGKIFTIDMCKDGTLFGEVQGKWLVSKTFISKDLVRTKQNELEFQMIDILMKDLKMQSLLTGKTDKDLELMLETLVNKNK